MSRAAQPVETVVSVFGVDDIPPNWNLLSIGDVTDAVSKVNPKDEPNKEIQYIDISGIDNERYRIADTKTYVGKDAPSRARQLVQSGDIVFSTVRTYLKNFALVPPELDGQVASTGFCVLRASDPAYQRYLFYFIQFDRFLNELAKQQRGTSYPAVRDGDIRAQYIPMPPPEHAESVVAEIEKQFSRLDEAVASLKRVKANLKRYKAAVLKAAVEGKLTEEWRKQNPNVEPASKLLERILAERRTKWEEAELTKMKAKGKEPKSDKWKHRYQGAISVNGSDLPTLPESWAWATVDQLAAPEKGAIADGPFGSNLKTAHYTDDGPRVIRLQNIGYGQWFDEKAHISKEHFQSLIRHSVTGGDVLIASLGDPAPRACLVPEGLGDAIVKADCIRFRTHPVLSSRYMVHALSSWGTQRRTTALIHGVGRPRLNMTEIKSIALSVPPMAEQIAICKVIDEKWSVIDSVEREVEKQLVRSGVNRQSFLSAAFSGMIPRS